MGTRVTSSDPCSMQRSSRASSLNSEAQNVANEAADAGPSDSAGRSPAERSTRKRKADSDEGPGLELAEQPKQQKQKVAYAAYIDSRTGRHEEASVRIHSQPGAFFAF